MKTVCLFTLFVLNHAAFAHDLYLTTKDGQICAGIGEHFPASMNAVTPDRVGTFTVRSDGKEMKLEGKVQDKEFCAAAPGASFVAEMTIPPRFIRIGSSDFTSYIHGEGLRKVEEARAKSGQKDKDGRELYSRYTKIFSGQIGESATEPIGHTLEIVPLSQLSQLKSGKILRVRVLFKGKPLADVQVAAVYAEAKLTGHEYPVVTGTDSKGIAELKIDRSGLWYARLIYMEAAQNDPEVDWRSYFATMTFHIPE